ncbi:hypothetical protein [Bradyrhizobium sp. STM 3561]|uniref:hypothetical protein n=1 Tax=Bradyrhizobium sp. STM 3561 TaxID=578923 RepID=UPI00388D0DBD
MANRFLAGYHAAFNQYGIWLSVPGVDVTASGPAANFLLRPDFKCEQIIISGRVAVAAGFNVDVMLPITVPTKRPYVQFGVAQSGVGQYPHDLSMIGTTAQIECIGGCLFRSDRLTFSNSNASGFTFYYDYLVFQRGIN